MIPIKVLFMCVFMFLTCEYVLAEKDEWNKEKEELPTIFNRIHVVSDVVSNKGNSAVHYKVECWYFEHEMIVRTVSDKKSDMLAYEDKVNSIAKYWEKGFDSNTPYFFGEILDGEFLLLTGYGDYWLHQKPILKFGIERSSKKVASDNLTTVTYRSRYEGMEVVSYQSAIFKNGKLAGWEMAGDINGDYKVRSYRTFSDYDAVTQLPLKVEYQRFLPPIQSISQSIISVESIPDGVTAQELLSKLSEGYRPVKKEILNDPKDGAGYRSSPFSVWLVRILLAGVVLSVCNYLYTKFLRTRD